LIQGNQCMRSLNRSIAKTDDPIQVGEPSGAKLAVASSGLLPAPSKPVSVLHLQLSMPMMCYSSIQTTQPLPICKDQCVRAWNLSCASLDPKTSPSSKILDSHFLRFAEARALGLARRTNSGVLALIFKKHQCTFQTLLFQVGFPLTWLKCFSKVILNNTSFSSDCSLPSKIGIRLVIECSNEMPSLTDECTYHPAKILISRFQPCMEIGSWACLPSRETPYRRMVSLPLKLSARLQGMPALFGYSQQIFFSASFVELSK